MQIDTSIRSPNHSPRVVDGTPVPISILVVHATAGSARSALAWLTNPAARVSAHIVIDKAGRIFQLVPLDLTAWHAGRSAWRGQTAINERSIGIELENRNDGRDPYPAAQIDALVWYSRRTVERYGITAENVVRHLDIAVPRGRKTDPAGFPWAEYRDRLFGRAPLDPARYVTRYASTLRAEPNRASRNLGMLPKGAPVLVSGWADGELVSGGLGVSDLWARVVYEGRAGYIWGPQIAAEA